MKHYDYSRTGAYFVTVCTKDRNNLLCNKDFSLSSLGKLVDDRIKHISYSYTAAFVDKYVIMPNHIHMIICIKPDESGHPQPSPSIAQIINQFKGASSKSAGFSLWQKGFYDHIIRNRDDYIKVWTYIDNNPKQWEFDTLYSNV